MNHLARTIQIQQLMQKENADWFLVTHLHHVRYLSGFTGSFAILLLHRDRRYILTDGRYSEQVVKEVRDYEAVIQGKRKEIEAIRDIIGDLTQQTLWFESDYFSVTRYSALCEHIPAKSYVPKRGIVESLRCIKDEEEIASIRHALQIAEEAFEKALSFIHEGMSERELAHFLLEAMWQRGAVKESFDPLILFGARSSLCHGKPSHNTLKKGDTVLMDFGCLMPDGYNSDITRTVFWGQPTTEQKDMYQCVLAANLAAENQLRAGIHGIQGDRFAREIIQQAGRENQFVHGLGHGVGLEIHEAPRLSPISEYELVPRNVVTVEPGVYIAGQGGIRIEDMVVIRENGCEVLNRSSKTMLIL